MSEPRPVWVIDDDSSIRWVLGKALQHEIAMLRERQSSFEDLALEAMMEAEELQGQVASLEEARASVDDVIARLREEIAEAEAEIETARAHAAADLEAEVGAMALGAAEEVVRSSLDDAAQVQLIEDYINQVGARP